MKDSRSIVVPENQIKVVIKNYADSQFDLEYVENSIPSSKQSILTAAPVKEEKIILRKDHDSPVHGKIVKVESQLSDQTKLTNEDSLINSVKQATLHISESSIVPKIKKK